ncbi:MAG: hypothetical protein HOD97_04545 [Candidatus Marinimicrobia bacterium]|jgi:hypothetical protein|nr:hypothetical protein [Candidatus Neomarinimicrobiota bacterium]MBT3828635.1 hypothetical protein [Candidatus Neomarinimicrobiota bacterium]MBT3996903.1 hypothetical protein [Candidatus Neomarinimicrobiota bacterium]MBT4280867.1 hypothetical protein [Candidatus Neomarinimicrobiota bacterium]MBT4569573.1 hypothetical protein [Candidatus Neomarinimicrobiota bacterium]
MRTIENFILKFGQVDRRWIFLVLAIVVIIPILNPIGMPIRPTETTQVVYDAIEALPENSNVLLSVEYSPSTKPENHPMTISILRHFFRNGHKVFVTCLWPDGQFMAQDALKQVADEEFGKVYGVDYVFLGFRPGNEAVVKGIVSNIRKLYTVDVYQTKIDEIPLMDGITNFRDFAFLFSSSAGYPGTIEWVQYAADPTGVPMSSGVTSIQVNEVMPYVQAGQMKGVLAGMPGAAEYEALIGQKGSATSGMDAQSVAHLVIVLFIILGNAAYFIERKRFRKY